MEDYRTAAAAYVALRSTLVDKSVLLLAEDIGPLAQTIAGLGAAQVVAVHEGAEIIDAARESHSRIGIEFRLGSLSTLEIADDEFQVVVLADREEDLYRLPFLREVRRVLEPGGNLLVTASVAERSGARGGLAIDWAIDQLQEFSPLRVFSLGLAEFATIVEYAEDEEETSDVAVDVSVDVSLCSELGNQQYLIACGELESFDGLHLALLPEASDDVAVNSAFTGSTAEECEHWRQRAALLESELLAARAQKSPVAGEQTVKSAAAVQSVDEEEASFEAAAARLLGARGIRDKEDDDMDMRRRIATREAELTLLNAGLAALRENMARSAEELRAVADTLAAKKDSDGHKSLLAVIDRIERLSR